MSLANETCLPCKGDTPPLNANEVQERLNQLHPDWQINAATHLERTFACANFVTAMDLANRITPVAEHAGHHPDLHIAVFTGNAGKSEGTYDCRHEDSDHSYSLLPAKATPSTRQFPL